jgi:tRNA (guanine-N7-)-methyltransferase
MVGGCIAHSALVHYLRARMVTATGTHPRPYSDAPMLPTWERVDVRALVAGAWVELEIGPGRGGFLLERAEVAPEVGLVGLEVRRKWAAIVDARLARHGFAARARVFAEDARFALPRLGPDGGVRRVFLHFPDPWWKKRHHKRLVVGDRVLDEIARLLPAGAPGDGGELFVQTDVEERAQQYELQVSAHPAFAPHGDAPGSPWLAENPYGARSPREHRAIADGLPIFRLRYVRRPAD